MTKAAGHHLKLLGSGSSGGGSYDKVRIMGEGSVNNDLLCVSCKTNGNSRFFGNVKTESFRVNGSSETNGSMKAQRVSVFGELKVKDALTANELKVRGSLESDKDVRAEKLDAKGFICVKGDCEAERLSLKGSFNVGGLLNAGRMNVRLKFPSEAREIGGENIRIARSLWHMAAAGLKVGTVEGDDIYLEYTKAEKVRGNDVRIGPGCEIGLIEYTGTCRTDTQAKVQETIKI